VCSSRRRRTDEPLRFFLTRSADGCAAPAPAPALLSLTSCTRVPLAAALAAVCAAALSAAAFVAARAAAARAAAARPRVRKRTAHPLIRIYVV
jgi:hypothetical protein